MIRLNLIVEGQTEEAFANRLLKPHLAQRGVFASTRCVETGRRGARIYRGGLLKYEKARKDISLWMKEDRSPEARFTTMFDFFRLPASFPGMTEAARLPDPYAKVALLEDHLKAEIDASRFIPYLQLHEFEALLFADPGKLIFYYPDQHNKIRRLIEVADAIGNPELINGDPATAPSKRIIKELSSYAGDKAAAGPEVASQIGLEVIREKCRHFNEWVTTLEVLDKA